MAETEEVASNNVSKTESHPESIFILAEFSSLENINLPIRSSARLKYTCLTVCKRYIACGTNAGSLYIFQKDDLQYLQMLPTDGDGGITQVLFNPVDDNLCAYGTSKGILIVVDLNIKKGMRSERIRVTKDHEGRHITAMQWNTIGNKIFVGDSGGYVSVVNVSAVKAKDLVTLPSEVILKKLDSAVIQLDCYQEKLLVSTLTRCHLCSTARHTFTQIGKRLRDGPFGACFYQSSQLQTPSIYCARPGSRMWEVDYKGNVLNTHQFKQLLAVPPVETVSVLSTGSIEFSQLSVPQSVNFKQLLLFGDHHIVTWSDQGLYIFDPAQIKVVLWNNQFTDIQDIVCFRHDLYLYRGNNNMSKLTFLPMEKCISRLFVKKEWLLCATLCSMYSHHIIAAKSRYYIPQLMLQELKENLTTSALDELVIKIDKILRELEVDQVDGLESLSSSRRSSISSADSVRLESGIYVVRSRSMLGFDSDDENYTKPSMYTKSRMETEHVVGIQYSNSVPDKLSLMSQEKSPKQNKVNDSKSKQDSFCVAIEEELAGNEETADEVTAQSTLLELNNIEYLSESKDSKLETQQIYLNKDSQMCNDQLSEGESIVLVGTQTSTEQNRVNDKGSPGETVNAENRSVLCNTNANTSIASSKHSLEIDQQDAAIGQEHFGTRTLSDSSNQRINQESASELSTYASSPTDSGFDVDVDSRYVDSENICLENLIMQGPGTSIANSESPVTGIVNVHCLVTGIEDIQVPETGSMGTQDPGMSTSMQNDSGCHAEITESYKNTKINQTVEIEPHTKETNEKEDIDISKGISAANMSELEESGSHSKSSSRRSSLTSMSSSELVFGTPSIDPEPVYAKSDKPLRKIRPIRKRVSVAEITTPGQSPNASRKNSKKKRSQSMMETKFVRNNSASSLNRNIEVTPGGTVRNNSSSSTEVTPSGTPDPPIKKSLSGNLETLPSSLGNSPGKQSSGSLSDNSILGNSPGSGILSTKSSLLAMKENLSAKISKKTKTLFQRVKDSKLLSRKEEMQLDDVATSPSGLSVDGAEPVENIGSENDMSSKLPTIGLSALEKITKETRGSIQDPDVCFNPEKLREVLSCWITNLNSTLQELHVEIQKQMIIDNNSKIHTEAKKVVDKNESIQAEVVNEAEIRNTADNGDEESEVIGVVSVDHNSKNCVDADDKEGKLEGKENENNTSDVTVSPYFEQKENLFVESVTFGAKNGDANVSEKIITEQINTEQINTEQINTEQINTEQINTEQINSEQINTEQINTEQINTEQINTEQINTEQINTEQINTEQINTEQIHGTDSKLTLKEDLSEDTVEQNWSFDASITHNKEICEQSFKTMSGSRDESHSCGSNQDKHLSDNNVDSNHNKNELMLSEINESIQGNTDISYTWKNVVYLNDPFCMSESLHAEISELVMWCFQLRIHGNISAFGTTVNKISDFSGSCSDSLFNPSNEKHNVFQNAKNESKSVNSEKSDSTNNITVNEAKVSLVVFKDCSVSTDDTVNCDCQHVPADSTKNCDCRLVSTDDADNCDFKAVSSDNAEDWRLFFQLYFHFLDVDAVRKVISVCEEGEFRKTIWKILVDCLCNVEDMVTEKLKERNIREACDLMRSGVYNKMATLSHITQLYHLHHLKTLDFCLEMSHLVTPLDVLFITQQTPEPSVEHFLYYINKQLQELHPDDRYSKYVSLCEDEEVERFWIQALLSDTRSHPLVCTCGKLPIPGSLQEKWKHEEILNQIIKYTKRKNVMSELCSKMGYWRGFLKMCRDICSCEDIIKILLQLGDAQMLKDMIRHGKILKTVDDWEKLVQLRDYQEAGGGLDDRTHHSVYCLNCHVDMYTNMDNLQAGADSESIETYKIKDKSDHQGVLDANSHVDCNKSSDWSTANSILAKGSYTFYDLLLVSWEDIARLLLKYVGSKKTIDILGKVSIPDGALSAEFYQSCLLVTIIQRKQRLLVHGMLEKVDTYLWSKRPSFASPQFLALLQHEQSVSDAKSHGDTLAEVNESLFANLLSRHRHSQPRYMEDSHVHWGVTVDVNQHCVMCDVPLTTKPAAMPSGAIVFQCGHGFHKCCVPQNVCIMCLQQK